MADLRQDFRSQPREGSGGENKPSESFDLEFVFTVCIDSSLAGGMPEWKMPGFTKAIGFGFDSACLMSKVRIGCQKSGRLWNTTGHLLGLRWAFCPQSNQKESCALRSRA